MTPVKEFGETVCDLTSEIAQDELAGVGYYTAQETEVIYEQDDICDKYTRGDVAEILDSARFESLGKGAYEAPHGEELTATIRTFESIATITLSLSERTGVLIAIDYPSTCSYQAVLQAVQKHTN